MTNLEKKAILRAFPYWKAGGERKQVLTSLPQSLLTWRDSGPKPALFWFQNRWGKRWKKSNVKIATLCKYQVGQEMPGFLWALPCLLTLGGRTPDSARIPGQGAARKYFELTVATQIFTKLPFTWKVAELICSPSCMLCCSWFWMLIFFSLVMEAIGKLRITVCSPTEDTTHRHLLDHTPALLCSHCYWNKEWISTKQHEYRINFRQNTWKVGKFLKCNL